VRRAIRTSPKILLARLRPCLRLEQSGVLAVALCFQLRRGNESQRRGIHAVPHAGRTWAVVEEVAKVRIGVRGADFGAGVPEKVIRLRANVRRVQWPRKARPASARVVLVEGAEKRLARDDVDVNAGLVVVPVRVAERSLGHRVLCDCGLEGRQFFLQFAIAGFYKDSLRSGGGRGSNLPILRRYGASNAKEGSGDLSAYSIVVHVGSGGQNGKWGPFMIRQRRPNGPVEAVTAPAGFSAAPNASVPTHCKLQFALQIAAFSPVRGQPLPTL
jgi:hypothetical protein